MLEEQGRAKERAYFITLFQLAKVQGRQGQLPEALENLGLVKQHFQGDADPRELATTMSQMASIQMQMKAYDDAEASLAEAASIEHKAAGPNSRTLAAIRDQQAQLRSHRRDQAYEDRNFAAVRELVAQQMQKYRDSLGAQHHLVRMAELELAAIQATEQLKADDYVTFLSARKTFTECVELDRMPSDARRKQCPEAIAVVERLFGPEDYRLPFLWLGLGTAEFRRGAFPAARTSLERALAGFDKTWPQRRSHPFHALALRYLGQTYSKTTNTLPQAVPLLERALVLTRETQGENEEYARVVESLAQAQRWRGLLRQAETLTVEWLQVRGRLNGPESAQANNARFFLGDLALTQGDGDAALQHFTEVLRVGQLLNSPAADRARVVSRLGAAWATKGDLTQGEKLLREALSLHESSADQSSGLGVTYRDLGTIMLKRNQLAEAEKYYRLALDVLQRFPPTSDLMAAQESMVTIHYIKAAALEAKGNPKQANDERRAGLVLMELARGKNHSSIRIGQQLIRSNERWAATDASLQPQVQAAVQRYHTLTSASSKIEPAAALAQCDEVIDQLATILGPDDYRVAMWRWQKVLALQRLGRPQDLQNEAANLLALLGRIFEVETPFTADVITLLGQIAHRSGRLSEAADRFRQAGLIYERETSATAVQIAYCALSYGQCRLAEDRPQDAYELIRSATNRYRVLMAGNEQQYLESLAASSELAVRMGDYELAEAHLREGEQLLTGRRLGGNWGELAWLRASTRLYLSRKDYQAAEGVARKYVDLIRKLAGSSGWEYGYALRDLTTAMARSGDYVIAEPLAMQALNSAKTQAGNDPAAVGQATILLAEIKAGLGNLAEAAAFAQAAVQELETKLGPEHQRTNQAREQLARIQWSQGNPQEAELTRRKVLSSAGRKFDQLSNAATQEQAQSLADEVRQSLYAYLSLPADVQSPEVAYEQVLRWKGAGFVRQQRLRQVMRNPENADLVASWQRAGATLATEALRPPFTEGRLVWLQSLSQKRFEFNLLDAKMGRLGSALPPVQLAQLQAALPGDAVLVDMVAYPHSVPNSQEAGRWLHDRRLAVFIVRKDQPTVRLTIENLDECSTLVQQWRAKVEASSRLSSDERLSKNLPELAAIGEKLRDRVWTPIAANVQETSLVLLSPDAELNALPFGALPGKTADTYLVEEKAFQVVPAARLLLENRDLKPGEPSLFVMGQVDYGAAPGSATTQGRKAGIGGFSQLTLDHVECGAVNDEFTRSFPRGQRQFLTKGDTTEGAFRASANRFRWLHLSTHGFFIDEFTQLAARERNLAPLPGVALPEVAGLDYGVAVLRHPGLQCGLGLAGANVPNRFGEDDGILSALEVSMMDLSAVEGVVLSACQTALGTIKDGEGVLGLQRAFHQAGVHSVTATLWSVPVIETIPLLDRYYRGLWEDQRRAAQALQQAQAAFLRTARQGNADSLRPDHVHPYYWAGFSVSADQL